MFFSPGHKIPSHFRRKILEGAHLPLKQLTPIESDIRCTLPSHRTASVWNTNEVKDQTWIATQLTRAYTEQIYGGRKEKGKKGNETKEKKTTLAPQTMTFHLIEIIIKMDGEAQWYLSDYGQQQVHNKQGGLTGTSPCWLSGSWSRKRIPTVLAFAEGTKAQGKPKIFTTF